MQRSIFTTALVALASSALSTTRAELTPFNATYDLFLTNQLLLLGAATDVVVDTHDQWMLDTFEPVAETFETALTEAAQDASYYWDLLTSFFEAATKHDKSYKDLQLGVSTVDQPVMSFAPRPWSDVTFAVFESVLPSDTTATVSGWADAPITWQELYDTQSAEIEAMIDTPERDTIALTVRMERLVHTLNLDKTIGRTYAHAWACLDKRMREAYQVGGVDPRLSCSDVPEI